MQKIKIYEDYLEELNILAYHGLSWRENHQGQAKNRDYEVN